MVDQIFIKEAAKLLNRKEATIRMWEREGLLPKSLLPKRNERGWRYWSEKQIEGIKKWIKETDRTPGKGLPYYKGNRNGRNQ